MGFTNIVNKSLKNLRNIFRELHLLITKMKMILMDNLLSEGEEIAITLQYVHIYFLDQAYHCILQGDKNIQGVNQWFQYKYLCFVLNLQPILNRLGNWPWHSPEDGGLGKKKFRYNLCSLSEPPRCIGYARRRMGRGGRWVLSPFLNISSFIKKVFKSFIILCSLIDNM